MPGLPISAVDMQRLEELQRLIKSEGGYSACALAEAIHWAKTGPDMLKALEAVGADLKSYWLSDDTILLCDAAIAKANGGAA